MARQIERLTAHTVRKVTDRGLHADGAGLYLQVTPSGGKSWVFRFTLDGRTRDMGLGPVHTIGLPAARAAAAECRRLRLNGSDPIEHRRRTREAARAEAAKAMTFGEAAEAYISTYGAAWRDPKHRARWRSTLSTYANGLCSVPLHAVDTAKVLRVLEPIWVEKIETANRVRNRIEAVLDWANARGYRQGDNPARWREHLEKLLPARTKVRRVVHRPALPYQQLPAFVAKLQFQPGSSAKALQFAILTATRTSETLGARWSEVDLDRATWTIPAARMKAQREHRIPLSSPALRLLAEQREQSQGDFIFAGRAGGLSNMALLSLLKRMGRSDITTHGFRSTFRDWAAEQTDFPREVAEMALAHAVSNKVEAAYRRGDLFDKRRQLMNDWGAFTGLPMHERSPEAGGVRKGRNRAGC